MHICPPHTVDDNGAIKDLSRQIKKMVDLSHHGDCISRIVKFEAANPTTTVSHAHFLVAVAWSCECTLVV